LVAAGAAKSLVCGRTPLDGKHRGCEAIAPVKLPADYLITQDPVDEVEVIRAQAVVCAGLKPLEPLRDRLRAFGQLTGHHAAKCPLTDSERVARARESLWTDLDAVTAAPLDTRDTPTVKATALQKYQRLGVWGAVLEAIEGDIFRA